MLTALLATALILSLLLHLARYLNDHRDDSSETDDGYEPEEIPSTWEKWAASHHPNHS